MAACQGKEGSPNEAVTEAHVGIAAAPGAALPCVSEGAHSMCYWAVLWACAILQTNSCPFANLHAR